MTDTAPAEAPTTDTAPAPVPGRRFNVSLSLFVDEDTRAYTLGRAVELQRTHGWATPRESEVLRAMLDAEIDRHRTAAPHTYNKIVAAGRAEMRRREQ